MLKNKITRCTIFLLISSLLLSSCGSSAPTDADAYRESAGSAITDATGEIDGNNYNEQYLTINENQYVETDTENTVTLSMKVDTASYTNVQRYIESGTEPPADAVRTEELINYFSYDTPIEIPEDQPFGIYTEIGPSPFDADNSMLFIRMKSKDIDKEDLPSSNFVFLIDTSGSMYSYDKLPLLQEAFSLLVENLDKDDTVSIVTYAGSSEVLLRGESGANTDAILEAINSLEAGGSTAGVDGINTAYEIAKSNFIPGGNNRVILATDGDFNVGPSSNRALSKIIQEKAQDEIYLSILGFGTGNIRDDLMETLSKDGNGNYHYIYDLSTAQKVLVDELASNAFVIANDVKAQVEFNPENVTSYRMIGYENRTLANEDFKDDTKDAGEIGIGTDVVILFELQTDGNENQANKKYTSSEVSSTISSSGEYSDELCEVRIRYKDPGETTSKEILAPVLTSSAPAKNSTDFIFASSVAAFGDLLRDSKYSQNITVDTVLSAAEDGIGKDKKGYRKQFIEMVTLYKKNLSSSY